MTDAERRLWKALRRDQIHGLHFRRQHPVGAYTLDFYCPQIHLAIELDGGQHSEADAQLRDTIRSRWLGRKGIRVVRFWNNDVLSNLDGVLYEIIRLAAEAIPSRIAPRSDLPFSRGGGASGEADP
jgi:very-short-patch-repair endonuclease